MEDLVIFSEGIGIFKFYLLIAAGAAAAAYLLLSRGIAASMFAIAIISIAWVKFAGPESPPVAMIVFWYIMNCVFTLSFIGFLRVGSLISAGRIRLFSTEIGKE